MVCTKDDDGSLKNKRENRNVESDRNSRHKSKEVVKKWVWEICKIRELGKTRVSGLNNWMMDNSMAHRSEQDQVMGWEGSV